MKTLVDTIINCGTLICVNPTDDCLHNTAIMINNGIIIDILPIPQASKYTSEHIIDAQNHIVMPGFINTHTHIPMAYFKGLSDDQPLETWLQKYIWPAEAKFINPEFIFAASLHGIAESIKNGTTCFCDMYFLPAETVKVCQQAGIRAIISDIGIDFPIDTVHDPESNFRHLERLLNSVADDPLIDFCICVHSIYTASKKTWQAAIEVAKRFNLLINTHLSETRTEVEDCIKHTGKPPVQYLYELGTFENRTLLAHGVHITEEEMQLIKGTQCAISANVNSNLKLASGIMPLSSYKRHNINVSLGTDSVASNNNISIPNEINTAGKLFKAVYNDPTFLPAKDLIRMATINGAKALGKESITGSIEVGKAADIICIDVSNFVAQPIYDPYSHLVYSMSEGDISHVLVNGAMVLDNRRLVNIDEETLLHNVQKNQKNIKEFYNEYI